MKLKDVAEIKFCLATPTPKGETATRTVLSPSKLADKTILDLTDKTAFEFEESKYKVDDDADITADTIIIKRICPIGIMYVEDVPPKIYASGNMILVKATEVDAKYLACILDREIPIIIKAMEGIRLPALTRKVIDDIEIPIVSMKEQKAIGKLWVNNYKLENLRKQLVKAEKAASDNKIYKYISDNKEK
jgi:restriction endonuclease S subunit